jgi:precorrin-4/cobalt-precorrin-4 C11-methyltransferase
MIIYAGSLVNPDIMSEAKADCDIRSSADMDLGEIVETMSKAAKAGLKVLRLHTGDPAIYGAIAEQMSELDKEDIEYEVIPGVSSALASAAALNAELTMAGLSQTVMFTRRAGRTPVPEGQDISSLAAHNATMCIFLSVGDVDGLIAELIEGGYTTETAVGVVYRATWNDEIVLEGTLGDIAAKIDKAGITRQAMIIVGDVLKRAGDYSLLYDAGFAHGYRPEKK